MKIQKNIFIIDRNLSGKLYLLNIYKINYIWRLLIHNIYIISSLGVVTRLCAGTGTCGLKISYIWPELVPF
jgi:hypothetical protein